MKKATLYKKLPKGFVECFACNHRCKIAQNKTGICGVRKNTGGDLQLLVYGRAIAANTDPIEKKPLYHFLPGSKIFSIGTVGCNFGCDFCQNFDISQASKMGGIDVGKLGYELPPKEIVEYCLENKIPSIAFTYNEPTIFSEYAVDVMKLARKNPTSLRPSLKLRTTRKLRGAGKIYGVYVSNGFFTKECFDYISPYIDAFNIDLKSFSDEYYRKICKARLAPVLESIKRVFKAKKHLEITTLVVPGKNDSKKELAQIAEFIAGVSKDIPWHISAFYPTYKMTDNIPTPEEKLFETYEIGKKAGLNYVYTGNISDMRYSQTVCPKCEFVVIARNGRISRKFHPCGASRLKKGLCPRCQSKIFGVLT